MSKIYKIQHIPTGKFIRVRLESEGIRIWKERGVLEGKAEGYGRVLYDTCNGWKTPPNPSNEEFAEINCKVVSYTVTLKLDI